MVAELVEVDRGDDSFVRLEEVVDMGIIELQHRGARVRFLVVLGSGRLCRELSAERLATLVQRLGGNAVSLVVEQLLDEFEPRVGRHGLAARRRVLGLHL